MAAKDASIASDYGSSVLLLAGDRYPRLTIELESIPTYQPAGEELFLVEEKSAKLLIEFEVIGTPTAAGVTYRMRGFDENVSVNGTVYWNSTTVDDDASDYTGSAGPVVNIIVSDVIGD